MTVVLGGGRGTRLFPLTAQRAKPAVPLAAKYRLIDIPLSNAINSNLREVFVLTQFNSASLNAHIARTYRFDMFTDGFVEVLAAEQTDQQREGWFQGTADAVRKHLRRFLRPGVEHVVILSGDHLYRMRYDQLVAEHEAKGADITVAVIPVEERECSQLGVLAPDSEGLVHGFVEKPTDAAVLSDLRIPDGLKAHWGTDKTHLASMGIYVFRAEVLANLLANEAHVDFGKEILPAAIGSHRVQAYLFDDYWEDIGTIQAFFDANLRLTEENPPFQFYVPDAPIYTRARFLPPTIYRHATVERALVAEGCLLDGATVVHSTIGQRSWLLPGCRVEDSILMGADRYEVGEDRQRLIRTGTVPLGIGEGASIRRAIIDKDARIGAGAVIHGNPDRPDEDAPTHCVRDGIVIVRKYAEIPPGTVV
ncbi:MAG: glucose-1-phosphate adenylyltransferase [Myxococcales bacterium]|nr:glucose-1-phosphate adenylyltransferase [Myxococcales bacterium]